MAAAGGAALGNVVSLALKKIGNEVYTRVLSSREEIRVGAAIAFASNGIRLKLEQGEQLRNDGFFDANLNSRSNADEVLESILIKCQRETQEKKIQYMSNLFSSIAFDNSVNADMAQQLIKCAETLTYRQFQILRLSGVGSHSLRQMDYRGITNFDSGLMQILYEYFYLYNMGLINFGGEVAFGITDVIPGKTTVQGFGAFLYNLMKLSEMPSTEFQYLINILQ